MAVIGFCIHPITGSVHATLKLAKQLRTAGHQIYYLGVPDCEEYIDRYGFDFISVFGEWFPRGWLKNDPSPTVSKSTLKTFFWVRERMRWVNKFIQALIKGEDKEFVDSIRRLQPRLIIIVATHYDSFIWALLSYKAGIRCIYLHDTLCRSAGDGMPPITTGIVPRKTLFSRFIVTFSWKYLFFKRFLYQEIMMRGVNLYSKRLIRNFAESCGYPVDEIDFHTDMLAPKLNLPELVLCPSSFDFPDAVNTRRYYAEASIDFERKEAEFPWEKIDPCHPIIYCALGSLSILPKKVYQRFFQGVIRVADMHPEYNWVVATGETQILHELGIVPCNVIIVDVAPQMALLQRASLMINHGGTNTVKECMISGVPIIAFPIGFDTYGNTARVVYHGLGIKGDIRKINPDILDDLFQKIQSTPSFQVRASIMKKVCIEKENAQLALNFIETFLK